MKKIMDLLFAVKTAIMTNVTVFQNAYHYAFTLDDKGLVMVADRGSWKSVAMSDIEGNYFYIRANGNIAGTMMKNPHSDSCGQTILERYPFTLIAIVTDADEFMLKDAITNTLLMNGMYVGNQYIDAPTIIKGELTGLKDDALNRVKARLSNKTLVRVDFNIERIFSPNTCEYKICKDC